MTDRRFALAVLAASLLAPSSALAVTTTAPHTLTMQAAMRPRNSQSVPYSGILKLNIDSKGIIQGTYVSNSIRPDPTNGKIISVVGGVTGSTIHLSFGSHGGWRVNGTLKSGHIVGTMYGNKGQIWDFEAIAK
jgi:hypothetical protein